MCGICGIYLRSGGVPSATLIARMRDLMTERGPDAAGLHVAPHIGIGTRRLRILDLGPTGEQPMYSEDGSVCAAFNGEIYNFDTLRDELEALGHVIHSTGDTAVLIHGFEQWGYELPRHLDGMFAFAIWDAKREALFLARDKVGKKPLFYTDQGDRVVFASDLKAVLAGLAVKPPLDPWALDAYLMFCAIPAPHTIFRGIRRLRPGEQIVFTASGGSPERYWRLSFRDPLDVDEPDAEEMLDHALRNAVRRRLQADVPLGALLSGGVDSSLVVAIMQEFSEAPVEAFTVDSCDGQPEGALLAGQVAAATGARHTVLPLPADSGLSHWAELVWQYSQPFGDPSALPCYAVAQLARRHVTVVLTGDGGDETFAGYPRYRWKNQLAHWQERSPGLVRQMLAVVGAHRPDRGVGAALIDQDRPLVDRLIRSSGWIRRRTDLYTPAMARHLDGTHPNDYFRRWLAETDATTDLARTLYADFQSWLPDNMLTKVDVATMAVGLEARCPLLDENVIQLAARLPDALKVSARRPGKYLLRRLAKRYLPSGIAYQPKSGFVGREADVLRRHPDFVRRVLSPRQLAKRDVVRAETVVPMVEEFLSTGRHERRIWLLLWLELWMRMFLDGDLNRFMCWDELRARA
jgi:asparagine synthase (glutamine-hydrolysing)